MPWALHPRHVVISTALVAAAGSHAQHENDRWVFGGSPFPTDPPALNFFSGTPVPVPTNPTSPFYTIEAAAAVADQTTGALLFYTDAVKVYAANHAAMPNGGASFTTNLIGCTSAEQGALILPRPGMPGHYFLFTLDCCENFPSPGYSGLRWSEVDMSLNGGLGDVIASTRNTPLWVPPLHNKLTERMTAARHPNGTDYWLVVHEWTNNNFLAFAVTCGGISTTPVISSVGAVHNSGNMYPQEVIGAMKISLDGTRLALTAGQGLMNVIEIFNFNASTGVVSNVVSLPANGGEYGLEFSPNGSRLYVTRYLVPPCCSGNVYQYNLLAGNAAQINASKVQLASSSTVGFGGLELGPDNKIHVARALQTNNLGVINNPNNLGMSAGFSNTGAALSGRRCNIALINQVRFQSAPDCGVELPVELLYFTGDCENSRAILRWATASEQNNDHFDVFRSRDGADWQLIGQVMGAGNSTSQIDYSFVDAEPMHSATWYYRLEQIDHDGSREELHTVVVDCAGANDYSVFVDANAQVLRIEGGTEVESVVILNNLGQVVLTGRGRTVEIRSLSRGVYVVALGNGERVQAMRFVNE